MSRSIEIRLQRLEAASAPVEEPRRVHIVASRTRERAMRILPPWWPQATPLRAISSGVLSLSRQTPIA
jgi:hypothetical protein